MSGARATGLDSTAVNPVIKWLTLIRESIVVRAPARYLESGASQYAGMLAFSLFVALVPLTIGVLTVFGEVSDARGHHERSQLLLRLMVGMFPAVAQGAVRGVMVDSGRHAGTIALLSVLGLVWFSTGVFSTIGFALNRIHGLPDRSFWEQRLRGFWVPAALFGFAYAALGTNLLIKLWALPAWLAPAAIWLTLTCLLSLVFWQAPSRKVPWIYVLPGAGLAAAAIIGLGYAFPYYAQLTGSLGGGHRFFATFFGLIAWVYFIAQAILIGAVFNRALKDVRQR